MEYSREVVTLLLIHHAAQIAYCLLAVVGLVLLPIAGVAWIAWRWCTK